MTFFLAFYLAYLLTFYLAYLLTFFPLRSGSAHCDLEVAVVVRQCPLRSGSRGWGPAVPTAIWKSRLRSGSAHCDLEVTVEVRQCPLRSGIRRWGPAVPTAIWKSRLRSGSAHCNLEVAVEVRQCPLGSWARGGGPAVPTGIWTARRRRRRRRWRRRMRRRRRRRTALIKSNNPHLAGGEQNNVSTCFTSQISLKPPPLPGVPGRHPRQVRVAGWTLKSSANWPRPGHTSSRCGDCHLRSFSGHFAVQKWWKSPWNPGVSPAPDRLSCRCHFIISTPKQSTCLIGVSCLFLVGGLEHVLFSIIYGMSSFPLTNSYFSRWVKPPTRFFPVKIIITTALIVPISWFVAGSLSRTNVADLGSASQ